MADQQYLSYDRVALTPKECKVITRKDCDTSVQFGRFKFKLPVCPSNMKSVVNEDLCIELAQNDYFYIMHRFGVDNKAFVQRCQDEIVISSISFGVQESDIEMVCGLAESCLIPDYVTIDIAHGHNPMVYRMIDIVKKELGSFVIAGNVATKEGAIALEDHGADACKVGIASGNSCTTFNKTGFMIPTFESLYDCLDEVKIPIIADGGIRSHGDIAKALVVGASMVMCGSIFAGCLNSNAEMTCINGQNFKEYFGSASEFNKSVKENIEGRKILVPVKESILDVMKEIKEDLQSAISYAGGKDLSALREVKFIII